MAARKQAASAAPAAPVQVTVFENTDTIQSLLTAADEYVGKVKASKLAMVTDQVMFVIDAYEKIRPTYDIAVAEFRGVEGSDAKYPMSTFTNKLTERGKVVRGDTDYVWPIAVKTMNTIVFWEGDADYHEGALDAFVAFCGKQKREISFGGYVGWLKGYRDVEGSWYTDDGEFTARGKVESDKVAATEAQVATGKWCSMDFELNLSGLSPIGQRAWIVAAIHDLEALKGKLDKKLSTADKAKAKKLLDGNIEAGGKMGGDRVSTALNAA
jgi:hypothetical protein